MAQKLDERGEELLKKFQFQNAKEQFMKAQEKKNHCADVYFQQSKYFLNHKKTNEALESLSHSIEMNPTLSEVHRDYGILLSQGNQIDNARLHLEKSLDLNYGDSMSHFQLGMIMVKMKDYEDAEQHFLSALDIDPELVDCKVELVALKLITDQKEEAKNITKKTKKHT
jgi:tetratricopeptide (TPR) repeat protein